MKKLQVTYLALMLGFAPTILAQTLSEEIVIERNIEPVERAVIRPSWVMPTILNPRVKNVKLSFNEYYNTAEITRSVAPLQPIAWADSVMRTPYKGYVSLGYFPAYNLDVGAGYRFVNTPKLSAGAHIGFQGSSWGGQDGTEGKNSRNELHLGADLTARFSPGSLAADFNYIWSGSGMAYFADRYHRGNQSINIADISLKWQPSSVGKIGWNIDFGFNYGGFTSEKTDNFAVFNGLQTIPMEFKPAKDLNFKLGSDLSYKLGETSWVDLGVGLKFRHTNSLSVSETVTIPETENVGAVYKEYGEHTLGIITLAPAYRFVSKNITGHLGIQVDFNTGGLQKDTHFAPNIDIEWSPASIFAVSLKATGGEVMNTNASLWERDPWMTGVRGFERSNVNADIQLGLTLGSIKGFWATLGGGWSSTSNWLTPVVLEGVNTWQKRNGFSGFNYGLELGYAWRDIVTVTAHAQGATHARYYRWQDNARWNFDIAAKVRPIQKLQVEAGYSTRLDRQGFVLLPVVDGSFNDIKVSLGNTSNLFVGAQYEITNAFSAFIKAENLLNRHWSLTTNVRSPGIHGLLGVQYLF